MDQSQEPDDHPLSADPSQTDGDVHRERLREELLTAADEESAAIVEAARQEITVTVRRARRDLRLIRAQLQLAGVEPRQLPMAELDPRHVARIAAASLEDEIPPALVAEQVESEVPGEMAVPPAPRSRAVITPAVLIALITVLFVTGAVVGWSHLGSGKQSTPPQGKGSVVADDTAAVRPRPTEPAVIEATAEATPRPGAAGATPRSVIRLQTLRPVWMRVDVDGAGDVGHEYPAGITKDLAPARSLVIRAGDAGAVMLSVGNGEARPLGPAGQVVTRRIAAGEAAAPVTGAKPPVAASAPTPVPAAAPVPVSAPVAGPGSDRSTPDVPRQALATPIPATSQKPLVAAPSLSPSPGPSAAPSPAPAAAAPSAAPAAAAPAGEVQSAIFARHVQWLDAYTHGDQAAIAALAANGYSVRDERTGRSANAGSTTTPLQVSDVHIDLAGVGAVLTARLRSSVDGVPSESLLSEVWVRGDQQRWSLMGVRITPVDKVSAPGR